MSMTPQSQQILNHLKQGNPITSMEALQQYRCMRLAARVKDLKDSGYNILSRMVEQGGKRFAEYRLAA